MIKIMNSTDNTVTMMPRNYVARDLQNMNFAREDLRFANFVRSDLRGADFSGANLAGADFRHTNTGITPWNTFLLFTAALLASLGSGYIAMMGGQTIQTMLDSDDHFVWLAGMVTIVLASLFIVYACWAGGFNAVRTIIYPVVMLALAAGFASYLSGHGSGMGMIYLVLSLVLIAAMFFVGTIARAVAGSLSNIIFLIVAFSGTIFGKSLGGEIATVVMSVSCFVISKRAVSGAKGFDFLRRIGNFITRKLGTSFRGAKLANARFSESTVRNADFSDADIALTLWGTSKKINCIIGDNPTRKSSVDFLYKEGNGRIK